MPKPTLYPRPKPPEEYFLPLVCLEMHGNKGSAKLHHFRAVDGGLQPGAMVERGVRKPIGGVVFAE